MVAHTEPRLRALLPAVAHQHLASAHQQFKRMQQHSPPVDPAVWITAGCIALSLIFFSLHGPSAAAHAAAPAAAAAAGSAAAAAGAATLPAAAAVPAAAIPAAAATLAAATPAAAASAAAAAPAGSLAIGVPDPAFAPPASDLVNELEVWALPVPPKPQGGGLVAQLGAQNVQQLRELCGRCLYRTLTKYVQMRGFGDFAIVLTGDIPGMWLRDSAVQIGIYLPRIAKRPALRRVVEGTIRSQSFFILQDPWANAYNPGYKRVDQMSKGDRQIGRGGWVFTRNWEVDSAGYYFNLLWNYYRTPAIWNPESVLGEPLIRDAVVMMLKTLEIELDHEKRSPYRYAEMSREGLGPRHTPNGMIWSACRPSDDPHQYPYGIPANMYVAGSLARVRQMNAAIWRDPAINATASRLFTSIRSAIERQGITPVANANAGEKMYAYEVDGGGSALSDFDDPNLPSLLSMPLLGYSHYDKAVYGTTRKRILSKANRYYFEGHRLKGMGSPHTNPGYIWPLATCTRALTTTNEEEKLQALKDLLLMSAGNGLVHESVEVNNPERISRPEFGWANAMAVVAVEQLLGVDCDAAAEEHRLKEVEKREGKAKLMPRNRGPDAAIYYQTLEADVQYGEAPAMQPIVIGPNGIMEMNPTGHTGMKHRPGGGTGLQGPMGAAGNPGAGGMPQVPGGNKL